MRRPVIDQILHGAVAGVARYIALRDQLDVAIGILDKGDEGQTTEGDWCRQRHVERVAVILGGRPVESTGRLELERDLRQEPAIDIALVGDAVGVAVRRESLGDFAGIGYLVSVAVSNVVLAAIGDAVRVTIAAGRITFAVGDVDAVRNPVGVAIFRKLVGPHVHDRGRPFTGVFRGGIILETRPALAVVSYSLRNGGVLAGVDAGRTIPQPQPFVQVRAGGDVAHSGLPAALNATVVHVRIAPGAHLRRLGGRVAPQDAIGQRCGGVFSIGQAAAATVDVITDDRAVHRCECGRLHRERAAISRALRVVGRVSGQDAVRQFQVDLVLDVDAAAAAGDGVTTQLAVGQARAGGLVSRKQAATGIGGVVDEETLGEYGAAASGDGHAATAAKRSVPIECATEQRGTAGKGGVHSTAVPTGLVQRDHTVDQSWAAGADAHASALVLVGVVCVPGGDGHASEYRAQIGAGTGNDVKAVFAVIHEVRLVVVT